MTLNEKMLQLRKQSQFTQDEVAEKLNVSRQAISKWESGYSIPSIDNLLALSKMYGVTVDYLVDETSSSVNMPGAKIAASCSKLTKKHILIGIATALIIFFALLFIGHITNSRSSVSMLLVLLAEGLVMFFIVFFVAKEVVKHRKTKVSNELPQRKEKNDES